MHEVGAPHLIDPSKLLKSAARLYGDEMDRLWGETAGAGGQRDRAEPAARASRGWASIYTPGHASHHVATSTRRRRGLRRRRRRGEDPAGRRGLDPDAAARHRHRALGGLDRTSSTGRSPESPAADPLRRGRGAARAPRRDAAPGCGRSRRGGASGGAGRSSSSTLESGSTGARPTSVGERIRSAMPPEQVWLGLERYWASAKSPDRNSGALRVFARIAAAYPAVRPWPPRYAAHRMKRRSPSPRPDRPARRRDRRGDQRLQDLLLDPGRVRGAEEALRHREGLQARPGATSRRSA